MTETATNDELQALRDRVAELEAARDKPLKVEIEGLEGLKQWSHAVETQQMDAFMLNNAVPDRVFWGWFWAFIVVVAVFVASAFIEYW